MVRLGYAHKRWVFPGGGLNRGEEPQDGAVREVREESGIVVHAPVYIGKKSYTNQYKKVTVFYFETEVNHEDLVIDGQEIIDAGWFLFDELPREVSPRVSEEITMYNEHKHGTTT